jgi:CRISPR-associated protein Cst2
MNSGEGGGGNVVELKTYRAGKRPYMSGQSVRHALREAIERANPDCFTSTPEAPSCDIANDWLCDLFGYLSPKKGEGSNRRWSPIKCTPALGQLDGEIVTDLLLRMSDLEKSDENAARDQRLAYVQLTENIYRIGLSIDIFNIGRQLVVEGDSKTKTITRREFKELIEPSERVRRVKAVIEAVGRMGDFAKQARNATSMAPDIFLGAVSAVYTQRGLRALELNDNGDVDVDAFAAIVSDLQEVGAELVLGHTPGVITNDAALLQACRSANVEVGYPTAMLKKLAEKVH